MQNSLADRQTTPSTGATVKAYDKSLAGWSNGSLSGHLGVAQHHSWCSPNILHRCWGLLVQKRCMTAHEHTLYMVEGSVPEHKSDVGPHNNLVPQKLAAPQ